MSYMIFNLSKRSRRVCVASSLPFSVPSKLIAKGVFLALLATLGTSLIVQPPMAQTLTQAQDASETSTVAKQLLGQWQAKDPSSNREFTFIFAPDGNLLVVLPAPDGSSVALKVAYQINPTTQPMQLDIQLSAEEKALTIFELTADGKLRLELEGLTPGLTRPTGFRPDAILFAKTSQSTTVPENIKVIEYKDLADSNNQGSRKPEDEAKTYMSALTQVQQAHYREQGKFATKIEDVSIGLKTETESYRYQFVPQGDEKQSVMITAVAKNSALPSYIGAVFVTKVNGETTTAAQICETEKPSTSPPAMPDAPASGSLKIQCPEGSRSLQ